MIQKALITGIISQYCSYLKKFRLKNVMDYNLLSGVHPSLI